MITLKGTNPMSLTREEERILELESVLKDILNCKNWESIKTMAAHAVGVEPDEYVEDDDFINEDESFEELDFDDRFETY